jgi:cadmium resistance protein CadD (predicted permease)
VSSLPASAATAVALFAATNIDDLVVLALLSASSLASGRPRRWEIWAGQYLGFAVLVGLSLAAGRGLSLVPTRWLWLLALIPLTIGVITLAGAIRAARRGEQSTPSLPRATGLSNVRWLSWMAGVAGVATLTFVDGADNLAAYTPVFATANDGRIAVTLAVFAAGVAVWCTAGAVLTHHRRITDILARYGRWILPAAFILIALYTLHATTRL